MEVASLKSETRTPGGRKAARRLRSAGMIPAVIYGHGEKPETVSISLHDLSLAVDHGAHVVTLNGAGDRYLIKEVQYDHLQATPIHADLMRVDATERVTVSVPIVLKGTPRGVTESGGMLTQVMAEVDVECLLLEIPESVRVSVLELGVGDALKVSDLPLPEGVKIQQDPNDVVAVVQAPRGGEEETEAVVEGEAEGAEPEVIGRAARETEEDEGGAS